MRNVYGSEMVAALVMVTSDAPIIVPKREESESIYCEPARADLDAVARVKAAYPPALKDAQTPTEKGRKQWSKRANVRNFFGQVTKRWTYNMSEYGVKPRNN